jgi:hypothetical protein
MKIAAFWVTLILNLTGLVLAISWAIESPGYEPVISGLAILVSTASLWYSRPYWVSQTKAYSVVQTNNRVGGDQAGRDIRKG